MLPFVASARNADVNFLLGPLPGSHPTWLRVIDTGREIEKSTHTGPWRMSAYGKRP
jgi:hypothetical protein